MRTSLFCFSTIAFLALAGACAAPQEGSSDDEASSEDELRASNCELGATCASSIRVLDAVDFGSNPPRSRVRRDMLIGTTQPWSFRQWTSGRLTAKADLSVALTGAGENDPIVVDNVLLFEVLDASTSQRIAAAFTGYTGSDAVLLDGVPVARLGDNAFQHAARAIDIGALLPKDRAFRVRVSALDYGGLANLTNVVARVGSKQGPAASFTLAGDASGTQPIAVDDDLVVKVNGAEVARTGSRPAFTIPASAGDALRLELVDSHGGCISSGGVWLTAAGHTPRQLFPAIAQECGTQASSAPFAFVDAKVGEPVVVDQKLDEPTLAANQTPIGRSFTTALTRLVNITYFVSPGSNGVSQHRVSAILRAGFNLGTTTNGAFNGRTQHFNLTPAANQQTSREQLDAIIAWWQPEIPKIRAEVEADHAAGRITTSDRGTKMAVLDGLQRVLDQGFVPLRRTFDRYPNVASVVLR